MRQRFCTENERNYSDADGYENYWQRQSLASESVFSGWFGLFHYIC